MNRAGELLHPSESVPLVAMNVDLSWERGYDLVQKAGQSDRFGSSHGFTSYWPPLHILSLGQMGW